MYFFVECASFYFSDLEDIKPKNATAKIMLLGSYDPEKQLIIEDPYYVCMPSIVY